MSRLVVDLDALADLIAQLQRFESHLARTRERVEARARLMHVSWTGEAAAAQASAHAQWEAGAAEVRAALGVLRSIASTAQANYTAAQVANRRMWAP